MFCGIRLFISLKNILSDLINMLLSFYMTLQVYIVKNILHDRKDAAVKCRKQLNTDYVHQVHILSAWKADVQQEVVIQAGVVNDVQTLK